MRFVFTLTYVLNGQNRTQGFDDRYSARLWKVRQESQYGNHFQFVSFRRNDR